MKDNKMLIGALVLIVLVGGYFYSQKSSDTSMTGDDAMMEETMMNDDEKMMMADTISEDSMMKETDDIVMMALKDMTYAYKGELADVSGGTASGTAMANYSVAADQGYVMYATFENLPALEEGFFYEGWIVRRGAEMSVISTGELSMVDGVYTNTYTSDADLTDHDFYVLTLEPRDNDPAPADHILEGVMTMTDDAMMIEK